MKKIPRLIGFALILLGAWSQTVHAAESWRLPGKIRTIARPGLGEIARATYDALGPVIYYDPAIVRSVGREAERFWLAHEYAHFVLGHFERRALASSYLMVPLTRTLEDEADCAAAEYLATRAPAAVQAAALALQRKGGSGDGVHQPDKERADYILQCLNSALKEAGELSGDLLPEPETLMFEPGESEPDAIAALELEPAGDFVKWNTSGRPAKVTVEFSLKNTGRRPVQAEMILQCGVVPKDREKDDFSVWFPYDSGELDVTLRPGEQRQLKVTLRWPKSRPLNTMPALRWVPLRLDKAVAEGQARCRFAGPEQPLNVCSRLETLILARTAGFKAYRGKRWEKEPDDDSKEETWDATLDFPGSDGAQIRFPNDDGVAEYSVTLKESLDATELDAFAESLAGQVERCVAGKFARTGGRPTRTGARFFTFYRPGDPDETAVVEVYQRPARPERRNPGRL